MSGLPPESPYSSSERKHLLLQECLPGVTLYDNIQTHHRRQSSLEDYYSSQSAMPYASSSYQSQGVEVQQQAYLTNHPSQKNKNKKAQQNLLLGDSNSSSHEDKISHTTSMTSMDEASSVHILWIGHEDDDDGDGYGNSPSSLRQAAALARARRHTERMWIFYFKTFVGLMIFWMFWSEFKTPIRRRRKGNKNTVHNVSSAAGGAPSVPLSTHVGTLMLLDDDDGMIQQTLDTVEYIPIAPPADAHREKILEALKNLDEEIKGDIILLSNKTKFIDASTVWQQQLQLSPPLAVIEAKTPKDVQLALPILTGLARDYGLQFRTRSGGHSYSSGFSTVPGGVMLSLAKLNSIETTSLTPSSPAATSVNANATSSRRYAPPVNNSTASKIVTIEAGVKVQDFMQQVLFGNDYGGVVASAGGVGMGGFILGGGHGLMSRLYGLAIDNVIGMKVVTTDGKLQDVENGSDLFWGLRGAGGGNLGVVTSFDYRVYPTHDIKLEASVKVTLRELTVFLQRLGTIEKQLRPEVNVQIHGYARDSNDDSPPSSLRRNKSLVGEEDGLVTVSMFWMGDADPEKQTGMKYLKKNVVPLLPSNTTQDSVVYYYFSWSGTSQQREQDDRWKSVYFAQTWNGFLLPKNNTQEVWDDIQESFRAVFEYAKYASPKIELWGGAISDVPSNATAFPHRNALYNVAIELLVPEYSDAAAASDEANLIHAIWPSISRHLDGVYVNYPMPSLTKDEFPDAYWGENLDRLKVLKQKYDPYHALTFSQSIPVVNATINGTSARF